MTFTEAVAYWPGSFWKPALTMGMFARSYTRDSPTLGVMVVPKTVKTEAPRFADVVSVVSAFSPDARAAPGRTGAAVRVCETPAVMMGSKGPLATFTSASCCRTWAAAVWIGGLRGRVDRTASRIESVPLDAQGVAGVLASEGVCARATPPRPSGLASAKNIVPAATFLFMRVQSPVSRGNGPNL